MTNSDDSQYDNERQIYAPSWVDRITALVDRLPGSSWVYYLGLGLVLLFVQAIILWIEGALTIGGIDPAHAYLAGVIPFMLALSHYLDRGAGAALVSLHSALKASEEEYQKIHYRLTNLPARSTLIASLAALAFVFLTETIEGPYNLEALKPFPISANLLRFIYLAGWWVFGAFMYHTVHQLRLINRIYTEYTRINLFRMKPLYAFSNLTAFTAGSLSVITFGWVVVNPWFDRSDPFVLVPVLVFQLLAVVTFIWPQLGIHQLQIAEKERLLEEANQRFEATIVELHQRVDDGKLEGSMDMNMTLASLQTEMKVIESIPTWPWQPETVRWLATALLLPLGLWLIQVFLQRVMSQ